ncbi:MAG: SidA/IucD/PvdA family monooxygenase, partial [Candidatus Eisenbacteria bacterium]|nr:SidA/IucD/PvdA family monooxygenase [Candidatus Eisenbacteria bacterium]
MAPRDPQYSDGVERRAELDRHLQSNVEGLHIAGAANGSPLLKTCINEGVEVVRSISRLMPPEESRQGIPELAIIGAGPAGLAAALEARRRGYRFQVFEQGRPLNTILNFPAGKQIYAEPSEMPAKGELEFHDASKEELLSRWGRAAGEIEITRGVSITDIQKQNGRFELQSGEGRSYAAKRVIVAIGRMGNPRRLGIPGEERPCVHTSLLNPGKYTNKEIVVVGGGNSAAEAALALAPDNHVT